MGGPGSGRRPKGYSWRQSSKESKFKKNLRALIKVGVITTKDIDTFDRYKPYRKYIEHYEKKYKK